MVRLLPLICFLTACCLLGCQGNAGGNTTSAGTSNTGKSGEPADPKRALFEQVHSGLVQLSGSLSSLDDAYKEGLSLQQILKGEERDAARDINDLIDSAAKGLAEFDDEPPEFDTFEQEMAKFDQMRVSAIEALNDSLIDLREAMGTAQAMMEQASENDKDRFQRLRDLIEVAAGDVADTVEAFGGTVDSQESGN